MVALALLGCAAEEEIAKGPAEVAPAFELRMLKSDASVNLASLAGKTVIIDFWATWCVPCEFQVPVLNAFYEAHRSDSDVALFGVSVDFGSADVVEAWSNEHGIRYPILLDGEAISRAYKTEGIPTLVVIRADGTIDSRHVGLVEQAELEEILTRLRAAV